MESGPRRVLIVANRTAATPTLLEHVKELAAERPSTFALLIPDAPRSEHTDWTLDLALPLLERAARGPVEGLTGGEDPFEAIRAAAATDDYDAIVISTLRARCPSGYGAIFRTASRHSASPSPLSLPTSRRSPSVSLSNGEARDHWITDSAPPAAAFACHQHSASPAR